MHVLTFIAAMWMLSQGKGVGQVRLMTRSEGTCVCA